SQNAATRNRGKAIVNSSQPIYDQEPSMVTEDDETSRDKEIDKLMALISQSIVNIAKARETVGSMVRRDYQNDDNNDLENEQANNKMSDINNLLYTDFKKSQAELARRNSVKYVSKMEIECAQVRGDLISYKMESQKSSNKYTQTINDLNKTILEMKNKLSAHQETISILSQQKEAQIKLYKTHEDKDLDKVIVLENKVKVLDNIVYKTGQSVQTMNMLNSKCRTCFAKPEFLKKA
nr:hypothetical protein [Tanacetum cinerariifolium]